MNIQELTLFTKKHKAALMKLYIRLILLIGILFYPGQNLFASGKFEPRYKINKFLIEYFELGANDSNSSFSFVSVDLNQDSKKEHLVALFGMNFCGSGGCTLLILNNNFTLNSHITLAQFPIYVSKTNFSEGWKDIYLSKRDGKYALMQSNGNSYPLNPSTTKETKNIALNGCEGYLNYDESDRIQFEFTDYNIENENQKCKPKLNDTDKSSHQSKDKNNASNYSVGLFLPYIILILTLILFLIKGYRISKEKNKQSLINEQSLKTKNINPWLKTSLLTFALIFILTVFILSSLGISSMIAGDTILTDLFPSYEHPLRAGIVALILPLLGKAVSIWFIQIKYRIKFKYYIPFLVCLLILYPFYFLVVAFLYW